MVIASEMKWIAVVCLICFNVLILSPIVSYYLFKFIQKKDEFIIQKRYPKLVIIINILTLFFFMVHRPIHILILLSPLREQKPCYLAHLWTIVYFIAYLLIWLYFARFWLMFYDLKHANSVLNSGWKIYLDESMISSDFWIKHRHTFGSLRFTLSISFILWIITSLFWAIPYQISIEIDMFDNGPIYLLSMIFVAVTLFLILIIVNILFYATPSIKDCIYLRYELKTKCITLGVGVLYWCILMAFQWMVNAYTSNTDLIYSVMIVHTISLSVIYFFICTVSTIFVLRKIETDQVNTNKSLTVTDSLKKNEKKDKINLCDILMDKEGCESFIQYCVREFCLEHLLCFVELLMFKEQMNIEFKLENEPELLQFENLKLLQSKTIPKSHLIYNEINNENNNELQTYLKIAVLLFNKYINPEQSTDFLINISYDMRQSYITKMKTLKTNKDLKKPLELYKFFDIVIKDIYHLLLDSFNRFLFSNVEVFKYPLTKQQKLRMISLPTTEWGADVVTDYHPGVSEDIIV